MSTSEDDEIEDEDATPRAEPVVGDSSADEYAESAALNDVVDDYIGAASQSPQVEDEQSNSINDGKILHDNVQEYIPVSSPLMKSPEKDGALGTKDAPNDVEELTDVHSKANVKEDAMALEREENDGNSIDVKQPVAPLAHGIDVESEIDHEGIDTTTVSDMVAKAPEEDVTLVDPDSSKEDAAIAQVQSPNQGPVVLGVDDDSKAGHEELDSELAPTAELASLIARPTVGKTEDVNDKTELVRTKFEDEAEKSDAPYSSDGGNLGGELSEDMQADDEHESLDTEDDKRSLAEQEGETFDEEEAGKIYYIIFFKGSNKFLA